MWIITLIAIIASLTGYASMNSQIALAGVEDAARARSLAFNMASYRAGVINSVNADPLLANTTVTSPSFPTGYTPLIPAQWGNVVLTDGTIIVYSLASSPPDLVGEIATLAQGSIFAGRANTTLKKIEAPGTATSADQESLPDTSAVPGFTPITNGAAVWLAHRD